MSSLEESRKTEIESYEKLKEEYSALTKQLEDEKVNGIFTLCRHGLWSHITCFIL